MGNEVLPARSGMERSAGPSALLRVLGRRSELLWELTKRDFIGRYRGSILGVVWSLFNPVLLLSVYTVVFSVAFQARWGTGENESKATFATILFTGMIVHSFFAECLNRAPTLITGNPNYVKKVVFPLEILPLVAMFSALLHFVVSFCVLAFFSLAAGIAIHPGALLTPVLLAPLALMTLGLSWFLAMLGVFFRDVAQAMGLVTTVTMFLAPVFYSIDRLPGLFRDAVMLNPVTLPILQVRDAMLWGRPLDWERWAVSLAVGAIVCWLGFWCFQKSRHGFADAI